MVSMVSMCAIHCLFLCQNQNLTHSPLCRYSPYLSHQYLECPGSQSSNHQFSKISPMTMTLENTLAIFFKNLQSNFLFAKHFLNYKKNFENSKIVLKLSSNFPILL